MIHIGWLFITGTALTLVIAPLAAQPGESHIAVYSDAKSGYTFSYPNYFKLDHEFADGSGEVVGIRAEPGNGQEASIAVLIDKPRLQTHSVQAYTEQVKQDFAVMPRAKVVSTGTRKMLGLDAADVQVDSRNMRTRVIGVVVNGQDVFVRCVYTQSVAQMFAPACEMVADTLKMKR